MQIRRKNNEISLQETFKNLSKDKKKLLISYKLLFNKMRQGDSARERFLDALPEIINDTRLASQREKFDKKEGMTETDDNSKKNYRRSKQIKTKTY